MSDCKYASAGMVDTEEHAHVPDRRQGSGKLLKRTSAGGSIGTLRGTGDTDGNISQRPDDRLLLPEGKQQSYGMQKAVRGRVPGRECSGGTDGLPGKPSGIVNSGNHHDFQSVARQRKVRYCTRVGIF